MARRMLRSTRLLLTTAALTLAALGPATVVTGVAPDRRPIVEPGGVDDAVPADVLEEAVQWAYDDLEALEDDIADGLLPDPEGSIQDQIDDLWEWADRLDAADTATWDELLAFDDGMEALWDAVMSADLAPGPDAPRPEEPVGAAPSVPASTVAAPVITTAGAADLSAAIEAVEPAENAEPTTAELATADLAGADLAGAGATDGDPSSLLPWMLVAIGALAASGVLVWMRHRRARRHIPAGHGFHDLLDVSRRLSGARTAAEVEELAIGHAIRLTGAEAGAYLRHRNRRLSVGFVTEHDMFNAERLHDGVLDRVVGAGQDLLQISRNEPAIRNLPVSLLATPVFAHGVIAGAIVLFRDAERPFTEREHGVLTDLKPIVGSSLETVANAERARHQALTDGLTEVPNRRALDEFVAAHDGSRLAVAMIDLDRFKSVNDTFGHQGGDDLLRAVAGRIEGALRPDDVLYRYGGEEFAVVMPGTGEADAVAVAERVRCAIAATPFTIGANDERYQATASIGVAEGTDGEAVIGHADEALYRAKENGRDRVERSAPASGV